MATNQGFANLICGQGVFNEFMLYLVDTLKPKLERLANASTFGEVPKKDIKKIQIALPPVLEQRKIAAILSTVDDNIRKTNQIIDKTEELKRGLMQQLLTRGIGHTKFKRTEVGEIPEDWRVLPLKDIATQFVSGGTPSTSVKEYWNGDIPWITGVFVTERVLHRGQKYITRAGVDDSATHVVPKDGLLFVTRTDVGKVAKAGVDIAISQDLTGVIVDKSVGDPDFLVWYLLSQSQNLTKFQQGTTIQGILREDIEKVLVAVPSLPEQRRISKILSMADNRVATERLRKTYLEQLKRGIMQVLLTGRIRVKVEPEAKP